MVLPFFVTVWSQSSKVLSLSYAASPSFADRFLPSDITRGVLGARNGTQTDCRGSDATYKQGLQTNSWSSNRIRDVYSLPVALLALPECSSAFDVHTIDLEPRGQGCGRAEFLRLLFSLSPFSHRSSTVLQPFLTPFFLPLCRRFRAVHRATQTERKLYFDAYCTCICAWCSLLQAFIRRCLSYQKECRPDILTLCEDPYLKPPSLRKQTSSSAVTSTPPLAS